MTTTTATDRGTMVLMTRISRQIHRRAIDAGLGMHPKQYAVLRVLCDQPGMTQSELGAALCVDANTVVHLLDMIEEAGWAERTRDPKDRRRHVLVVTPQGKKAVVGAEQALNAIEDEVLADLDSSERAKLGELLRKAVLGG